jgi:hypothetical protein
MTVKNGILILLGECFRSGRQGTRIRGQPDSYNEQIKACHSHVALIQHIIQKYALDFVHVYIATYHTQYNDHLLEVYRPHLLGYDFYENVIGIDKLLHQSMEKIKVETYDFFLWMRIDIYLKYHFFQVWNPTIEKILYPSICWKLDCKTENDPRVNNLMLFIHKKYVSYIKHITIVHELWNILIKETDLTYDDMDVMIHTYHDSDSEKDYNPLYYIVNRNETKIWHSYGEVFDKNQERKNDLIYTYDSSDNSLVQSK